MKTKVQCPIILLVLLFCLMSQSVSFKYIIMTPGAIRSLHGLFSTIATSLAEADHEVLFVTPYPMKNTHKNIKLLPSPNIDDILVKENIFKSDSTKEMVNLLMRSNTELTRRFWADRTMHELINSINNFDAIITMSYLNEFIFPYLDYFSGSFIQVCTPGVEYLSISREGNWLAPSVVPAIILHLDDYMTFWERAINLPMMFVSYLLCFPLLKGSQDIVNQHFPKAKDLISYYDRVDLTLINGHFALDGPVPLLPSQVEIGTINAKKPKPLPKDLEDFVQSSGDAGIIYFSLGSIAKSSDIPSDAKKMFIEAFKQIPQHVLWKYEGHDLDLPNTVRSQEWMPQQDILGHSKTRLFISHCGNLGTQEAKYHGVPVLAMPIAFDQPRNAARMARKGYALVLQWEELTTDKIVKAISTLINDTSYKDRLETVSRILQDQKDTPAERAVWWLEYVVRHKGAPHLQYAGKRLSLFQYLMLDVILFWLAVLAVIIFICVYFIKLLCCSSKRRKEQTKEKKQ